MEDCDLKSLFQEIYKVQLNIIKKYSEIDDIKVVFIRCTRILLTNMDEAFIDVLPTVLEILFKNPVPETISGSLSIINQILYKHKSEASVFLKDTIPVVLKSSYIYLENSKKTFFNDFDMMCQIKDTTKNYFITLNNIFNYNMGDLYVNDAESLTTFCEMISKLTLESNDTQVYKMSITLIKTISSIVYDQDLTTIVVELSVDLSYKIMLTEILFNFDFPDDYIIFKDILGGTKFIYDKNPTLFLNILNSHHDYVYRLELAAHMKCSNQDALKRTMTHLEIFSSLG
ncbi:hypothetical protein A3Q56_05717 [Intoshia linei]|uniref:Uncharacterized protein n=1 Tax=Intoshia linei TaxID=1819745 RepID=A0A177AYS7_9BILA|nr:hypothetical protein A3Q56_05717 [Intoshia linei]